MNPETHAAAITSNTTMPKPLDTNLNYTSEHSLFLIKKFKLNIATYHPLITFTDMRGESCRDVASATSL